MDEIKRKHREAAGFVVGDFEQFATEVLGMSVVEARETQFRADLGIAIRKIRQDRKLTQAAFGKLVGLARPEVDRIESAAPEISLDLMLRAYFTAGGLVRYEFESPVVLPPAKVIGPDEPMTHGTTSLVANSPGRRKIAKAVKA